MSSEAPAATPAPAPNAVAFRGPLKVNYCSSCGFPPEYCEYGPTWEKCKVLLEKKHPDLLAAALARMSVGSGATAAATSESDAPAAESAASASSSSASATPAKKTAKGGDDEDEDDDEDGEDDEVDEDEDDAPPAAKSAEPSADDEFLAAAAPVKAAPKKAAAGPGIYLSMANRSKKKFITTIRGFESFGIVLKDVSKLLAKKFACAASVVKATEGNEIAIQGDLIQDLPHWIIEEYPQIDKKLIWTVDKAGKKVKAF